MGLGIVMREAIMTLPNEDDTHPVIVITELREDGPAVDAGLEVGDIVVAVGNPPVKVTNFATFGACVKGKNEVLITALRASEGSRSAIVGIAAEAAARDAPAKASEDGTATVSDVSDTSEDGQDAADGAGVADSEDTTNATDGGADSSTQAAAGSQASRTVAADSKDAADNVGPLEEEDDGYIEEEDLLESDEPPAQGYVSGSFEFEDESDASETQSSDGSVDGGSSYSNEGEHSEVALPEPSPAKAPTRTRATIDVKGDEPLEILWQGTKEIAAGQVRAKLCSMAPTCGY